MPINASLFTHSGTRNLDQGYFRLYPSFAARLNSSKLGRQIGLLLEIGKDCPHKPRLIPGADELVNSEPVNTTSAPRSWGLMMIDRAGLPLPPVTVFADDVTQGKPHPEPYLKTAARLGVPIERCYVLVDARAEVASGFHAGVTVIGVGTRADHNDLRDSGASATVANVAEFVQRRDDGELPPPRQAPS